jgi:thiamine-phosphate pyrophosphorylase
LNSLFAPPLLYLITDRRQFSRQRSTAWQAQLEVIASASQAGCQLIQIREKDLSTRELCEFVRAAISYARPFGAKILVNDRLDVALATGADGVHLRVNSLPASTVRSLVPAEFLLGVSTHSLAEAQAAEAGGADFIVCGPVYPTASKSNYGPPLGLVRLAEICQTVKLPVLGLGGIMMENYAACLAHGAAGIAAISLFQRLPALVTNIKMMLSSGFKTQD